MNNLKEDLMSLSSSNSYSDSDEEELKRPKAKRVKKNQKRSKPYPVKVAYVPKRTFKHIQQRLKHNKSVIDVKTHTLEKSNCNRFILNHIQGVQTETISSESVTRLIWEMRQCLQRKEYGNLARLILAFTEMPTGKMRWYQTLIKYCLIALMYDPLVQGTGLMDMFLDGVLRCHSKSDKQEFLRDIHRLPTNIHVSKYDELWSEYPLPNQLNETSLDQLCEILNKQINIQNNENDENDYKDESDIESDWETYDENSSDDENGETTEVEKVCDFKDLLNQLQTNISK